MAGVAFVSAAYQDDLIQQLYDALTKHWPRREKKPKKGGKDKADEDEAAEDAADEPGGELTEDSQDVSGETTPDGQKVVEEDEYLAWTLGGDLREVHPSPSQCPQAQDPVPEPEMGLEEFDRQLKQLEQLVLWFSTRGQEGRLCS